MIINGNELVTGGGIIAKGLISAINATGKAISLDAVLLTADQTITIQDASGTIALMSDVGERFYYPGGVAGSDFDLNGNHILQASTVQFLSSSLFIGTLQIPVLSTAKQWTLPDATGTVALTSDIPGTPTLDAVLGAGDTATDRNITLLESGGINNILSTNRAGKAVTIGSVAQPYNLELYGDINLHSAITGATTINGITVSGTSGTFALGADVEAIIGTTSQTFTLNNDNGDLMSYLYGGSASRNILRLWSSQFQSEPHGHIDVSPQGVFCYSAGASGSDQAVSMAIAHEDTPDEYFRIAIVGTGGTGNTGTLYFRPGNLKMSALSGGYSGIFSIPSITGSDKTWTLPNASGTFALTSDLASYLPLAGGTMTGGLSIEDATDEVILTLKAAAAAASDLVQLKDNSDNILFKIDIGGAIEVAKGAIRLAQSGLAFFSSIGAAQHAAFSSIDSAVFTPADSSIITVSAVLSFINNTMQPEIVIALNKQMAAINSIKEALEGYGLINV